MSFDLELADRRVLVTGGTRGVAVNDRVEYTDIQTESPHMSVMREYFGVDRTKVTYEHRIIGVGATPTSSSSYAKQADRPVMPPFARRCISRMR